MAGLKRSWCFSDPLLPFKSLNSTIACLQGSANGTNGIPVSFKVLPMEPLLAHLSRRLIGELIVYPWSSVCRPSSTMLKHLLLRNRLAYQSQIYVEPPWVRGTKFCLQHLGHMTKMAATPIYGKNPSKIFFSRTARPIFTKLGM